MAIKNGFLDSAFSIMAPIKGIVIPHMLSAARQVLGDQTINLANFLPPTTLRFFDTTLRDGDQAPGAAMTAKQKMDIARQLAKLGVDVMEAGFELVKLIAMEIGNLQLCLHFI